MLNLTLAAARFLEENAAARLEWWQTLQLDQIGGAVQGAWSAWEQDWVSMPAPLYERFACSLAHLSAGSADVRWQPLGMRGQAAAWMEVTRDAVGEIQNAIFGPRPEFASPLAPEEDIALGVARDAWAALASTLRDRLFLDADGGQTDPPNYVFKPWSGGVVLSPPQGKPLACSLLLNAECVRGLLQSHGSGVSPIELKRNQAVGITPLEEALEEHKLLLRAELDGCEVDVGELENLGLGDIVRLGHRLDEPLRVWTDTEGPLCEAFLGRQAGAKAIELVRKPT
jgi:hypothetical protein